MYNHQSSHFRIPIFLVIAISFFLGCTDSLKTALQYHQVIQTEIQMVKAEYLRLSELLGSRDKPAIEAQLKKLNVLVIKASDQLKELKTISNDFEYKALAIKQLQVLEDNLKGRYPKIIDLTSRGDLNEEQTEQLELIYDKIEDLEEPLFEQFEQSRDKFCKHYQIQVST